jgi:hypothetical protein
MDNHEKHAYLEAIRKRYRKAKRADKGKVLDEFCSVCSYQRKYAIRLLRRKVTRTPRRPGRPSRYNQPELLTVLRKIWLATDQMCSKRLVAAMPLWLPHYEVSFGVLEESNPDSHHALGYYAARFYGSRYGGALRQLSGRRFRLEPDFD